MAWELVSHPSFAERDLSSLLRINLGGAARPPSHVVETRQKLAGVGQGSGYGMTETNAVGAVIGGDDYLARPDSAGRAVPPLMEMRVVGPDGSVLGPDQEGEICMKSPANMRGYWNDPEATAQTLRDGWVHSGDLGRFDRDGYLYVTGRAKEIVIRGGENISTTEVEHTLHTHPAVFEAAVYGVPDERLGEALAATVMLGEGASTTPEALRAHVASSLARFKVPEHVWLQSEPLPRLASGKIDKRTLKQRARGAS
jgi:acyl-CoA synthetase (AMP-forming)/AMP-acid ligase II